MNKKGFTTHQSKTPVHGFTLVELLVTISIIAILAAIGLIAYSTVLKQGRDAKRQSDLRSIQSALEQYNSDQGYYPESLGSSIFSGSKIYMNTVPTDSDPAFPYCYKPLKSAQACTYVTPDCSNSAVSSTDKCSKYCLYAKLDSQINGALGCGSVSTYNFMLTPP